VIGSTIVFNTDLHKYRMAIQCIFIGDSRVGKTSIINAAISDKNRKRRYLPTIGVDIQHHVMDDNNVLNIWDTSGDPNFHSLVRMFEKSCQTIVYVFAANEPASFQSICDWHSELYDNSKIYICYCNKTDLGSPTVFKDRITHLYPEIIFVESSSVTDNGKRLLQIIIENSEKIECIQAHSLPRSCCKIS